MLVKVLGSVVLIDKVLCKGGCVRGIHPTIADFEGALREGKQQPVEGDYNPQPTASLPSYHHKELNSANNPNKREMDSSLAPPKRSAACPHLGLAQ